VAEEHGITYSNILDLFEKAYLQDLSVESSINHSGYNQTYIRTLYYALALDESLKPGFAPNSFRFDSLFGGFEGDYMSRENYGLNDVFYSLGVVGLTYAFAMKKAEDAIPLGRMLYHFTYGFEYQIDTNEEYPWSEKLERVMLLGTRLALLEDIGRIEEINDSRVELSPLLLATMGMDFHVSSPSFKQQVIGDLIAQLLAVDKEHNRSHLDKNFDAVSFALSWAIELGRCLVLLDKPIDFILNKTGEIIDAVAGFDSRLLVSRDVFVDYVHRATFFHYPELYASIFGPLPSRESGRVNVSNPKNYEELLGQIVDPYWIFNELKKPQNLLSENELLLRAAKLHGLDVPTADLPFSVLMSNVYKFSRFSSDYDRDIFLPILVRMIDGINETYITNGHDSSLHELEHDAVRLNESDVYDAYNRLLIRAVNKGKKFEPWNPGIGLLFKDEECRKNALSAWIEQGTLSSAVARLGHFGQEELQPYWKNLSSELKRDVLGNDIGL
jgi:hypothetical protein